MTFCRRPYFRDDERHWYLADTSNGECGEICGVGHASVAKENVWRSQSNGQRVRCFLGGRVLIESVN